MAALAGTTAVRETGKISSIYECFLIGCAVHIRILQRSLRANGDEVDEIGRCLRSGVVMNRRWVCAFGDDGDRQIVEIQNGRESPRGDDKFPSCLMCCTRQNQSPWGLTVLPSKGFKVENLTDCDSRTNKSDGRVWHLILNIQ